jgi:hypothetical protein
MSTSRKRPDNKENCAARVHAVHFITSSQALKAQAQLKPPARKMTSDISSVHRSSAKVSYLLENKQFPSLFRKEYHARKKSVGKNWRQTEKELNLMLEDAKTYKGEFKPTSLRHWLREKAIDAEDAVMVSDALSTVTATLVAVTAGA